MLTIFFVSKPLNPPPWASHTNTEHFSTHLQFCSVHYSLSSNHWGAIPIRWYALFKLKLNTLDLFNDFVNNIILKNYSSFSCKLEIRVEWQIRSCNKIKLKQHMTTNKSRDLNLHQKQAPVCGISRYQRLKDRDSFQIHKHWQMQSCEVSQAAATFPRLSYKPWKPFPAHHCTYTQQARQKSPPC